MNNYVLENVSFHAKDFHSCFCILVQANFYVCMAVEASFCILVDAKDVLCTS